MKLGLVYFSILLLIVTACGKNKIVTHSLPVAYSWEAVDMTSNNAALCAGVYNDSIYYVESHPEFFAVRFSSFDGKELSKIIIKRGKGPGQAQHTLGVRIANDIVYFADLVLQRISMFNLQGKFIDSIEFGPETGPIITFDVAGDMLYFNSLNKVYLGMMDLKTGTILKTIPYAKEDEDAMKNNFIEPKLGVLKVNPQDSTILFGNVSSPYRLDVYNTKLEKQKTYTHELDNTINPAVFDTKRMNMSGDIIITSIVCDATFIFTPETSTRIQVKSDKAEWPAFNGNVLCFNTTTGKLDSIISNENFKNMKGFMTVTGVTHDYIVLHVIAVDDFAKRLSVNDQTVQTKRFVVLKRNPDSGKR